MLVTSHCRRGRYNTLQRGEAYHASPFAALSVCMFWFASEVHIEFIETARNGISDRSPLCMNVVMHALHTLLHQLYCAWLCACVAYGECSQLDCSEALLSRSFP